MTRFTKEAMLNELRTIFLFTTDLIMLGAGWDAAEQFIGFEHEKLTTESFIHAPVEWVDLSRFLVTHRFEAAYDLAFQPSVLTNIDGDDVLNLMSFMYAVPRSGGVGCSEEHHAYMTPEGLCQTTVDLAWARVCLDPDSIYGDRSFTIRHLALLANMSEGAVRNALADKSENGLKAVPGSKPVAVEFEEAKRWLAGRRGFVPVPERLSNDPIAKQRLGSLQSVQEFGEFIRQCVLALKTDTQETLGISAWIKGTFIFEATAAQSLAEKFELDVPLFVGKALEVSLRRDAAQAEVQS